MNKKELYINLSEETRLSFLLMPVLGDYAYSWFYEKYINLVMHAVRQDENGVVYMIDFIDNHVDESYREYMQERTVDSYDEVVGGDFIGYIKGKIDKDFYLYTSIDKHHIPDNEVYMKDHFVHPTLIFGYDEDNREILCIDQSFTKGASKCRVKYEDFSMAFKDIKNHYESGADIRVLGETVTCFKLKKKPYVPPFEIKRFLSELYDYLHSTVDVLKERQMYFYSTEMAYGIGVYDKFMDEIDQFGGNHYMTFKSLQDFLRHKQYLLDRFAYIEKLYVTSDRYKKEMERYGQVRQMIDTARSLGIKYDMKEGRTPAIGLSKNPEFLRRLKAILAEAKEREHEILTNIYGELSAGAERKNKNTENRAYWDFAANRCVADISECGFSEIGDEKFVCTVTGHDPGIIYDVKHNLSAEKAKYIYATYRTTCGSETAQFYFATDCCPSISERQSKIYTISPNSPSYEYIIDMSHKPEWKGRVRQMRFDPVSNDNKSGIGECMVEQIEISDRLPTYGSRKDFIGTQGANNWSYHTFNGELTYREMRWDCESSSWRGIHLDGLGLNAESQSSRGRYSTVRRWTCPAGGRYAVNCTFAQTSDGILTDFTIKRNHAVLQRYKHDSQNGLSGGYANELELEKGETINFEFCNEDFDSVVHLDADIVISKTT